MQTLNEKASYFNRDLENFKISKSLKILRSKPQRILLKSAKEYKPMKKTFLDFQDKLYFIHKLCQNSSKTPLPCKSANAGFPKRLPSETNFVSCLNDQAVSRSKTPVLKPSKPRIKFKLSKPMSKQNTRLGSSYKAIKPEPPDEINGWETASFDKNPLVINYF
jgi:hypothetical protein